MLHAYRRALNITGDADSIVWLFVKVVGLEECGWNNEMHVLQLFQHV